MPRKPIAPKGAIAFAATVGLTAILAGGLAHAAPPAKKAAGPDPHSMSSLTGKPGDPANGRKVAIDRRRGNCLACHVMPIPEEQFHGHIGPDLNGVGDRYAEGELRFRVVDPKGVNPETMMPAFHKVAGLHRVIKKHQGKPILTAQEVEDVVAYLMSLREEQR